MVIPNFRQIKNVEEEYNFESKLVWLYQLEICKAGNVQKPKRICKAIGLIGENPKSVNTLLSLVLFYIFITFIKPHIISSTKLRT